jgi:hypothetical protein
VPGCVGKHKDLVEILKKTTKTHLVECRLLIASRRGGGQKKGELKNATFIRDVIENTRRENGRFSSRQDVYESKYVMRTRPGCL